MNQSELELNICSGFSLAQNGRVLALPRSRKARALLLYLLLNQRRHNRDSLCQLFWEQNADPRAALRWSMSKLRSVIGDHLQSDRKGVWIERKEFSCDLDVVQNAIQDSTEEKEVLERLARDFSDNPLSGFDCEDSSVYQLWLDSERQKLNKIHAQLLRKILGLTASLEYSTNYARRLLALEPFNIKVVQLLVENVLDSEGMQRARELFEKIKLHWRKEAVNVEPLDRLWLGISKENVQQGDVRELTLLPNSNWLQLPSKPSVAVLGFETLGDNRSNLFAKGLSVDLVNRLARLRSLFVSSLSSSRRFFQSPHSSRDIGRLLGVIYLIEGSVYASDKNISVNLNLVDAESGSIIWSHQIKTLQCDFLTVQDEFISELVSRVEPEIEHSEFERARHKLPETLGAWENYHMALWHAFRFTDEDTEKAMRYCGRAIAQDEYFSRANAILSFLHFNRAFLNSGHL